MHNEPYLPFPEFVANVQCEHCLQNVPQPFYVVKYFDQFTRYLAFCDEACHTEYYLEHLRKGGI